MRLGVVCDLPEEGWTSMDLCADMLLAHLRPHEGPDLRVRRLCAPYVPRLAPFAPSGRTRLLDRLANRLWDYPRWLARHRHDADWFHVCDHSYAHLTRVLPEGRAGVFCYDLDAFAPLGRAGPAVAAIGWHVRSGLARAAVVFHGTREVGRALVQRGLVTPDRLVYAPLGVAPGLGPDPEPGEAAAATPFLLHVGSTVPRKRIDVLLDVLADVRRERPDVRLVRVGDPFTPGQAEQARRLGVAAAVTCVRGVSRAELARLYRGAAAVLQPSEAEGFSLPVVEALACGASVVASDLPVHREVGGAAVVYRAVGDVGAWAAVASKLAGGEAVAPPRAARLAQAARFSWAEHARTVLDAYRALAAT